MTKEECGQLATMSQAMIGCDFCSPTRLLGQDEAWMYPCRDFLISRIHSSKGWLVDYSRGPWIACENHSAILELRGNHQHIVRALVNYARPSIAERWPDLQHQHVMVLALGTLWGNFIANRCGERHRLSDDEMDIGRQNMADAAEDLAIAREWLA